MSRTFHARRPSDESTRRAPRDRDERKRALFSFKRIHGITTSADVEDQGDPAITG